MEDNKDGRCFTDVTIRTERCLGLSNDQEIGVSKEDDSERFIRYFRRQLTVIDSAQFTEKGSLYKKVLFVTVIDALSKTVYPRKKPGDRFISLIRHYGEWKNCDRISLTHLVRLLEKLPDLEAFSKLREFALARRAKWGDGEIISLDKDPDYKEVQRLWPREEKYKQPLEKVDLNSLRHVRLLYSYRNKLIHEMVRPDWAVDLPEEEEPFYASMTDGEWVLTYPLKFFLRLCSRLLAGLGMYYSRNGINPYELSGSDTCWIETLKGYPQGRP
jgi:hypothetical protein